MSTHDGKRYYWLKLKNDFFESRRMKKLRALAGGDTYTIIYLKLQLHALKTQGVLTFEGLEDDIATEFALEIDEKPDDVRFTLAFLQKYGLLETNDNVNFFLPYVVENVGSETGAASRMREKRKELKGTIGNIQEHCSPKKGTIGNIQEHCSPEIEIEKEKEIEADKEKIIKKESPPKNQYREFVSMTETEYQTLCNKYGKDGADEMLDILDNFKGSNGKKYLSDYRAILSWVVDKWKEKHTEKPQAKSFKAQEHDDFMAYAKEMAEKGEYVP